jgi:hypothetical protein
VPQALRGGVAAQAARFFHHETTPKHRENVNAPRCICATTGDILLATDNLHD